MVTVVGLDLGTSGKTAICVVRGDGYKLRMIHMQAIQSISPPDVESWLERICGQYQPKIVLMEANGPGAVFHGFVERNKPHIPLATIDTSVPLPEGYELPLWGEVAINQKEYLNIRAAMYFTMRLMFRDQKITLYKDDEELAAQLSILRWDHDNMREDKLFMISKRKLKTITSELDEEPFSKSPDKADALALACFAYALIQLQENEDVGEVQEMDEIVEPTTDGYFPLVGFEGEVAL
jgi:hypothetical protein